ncbi:CPA_1a_G0000840.mRNA.1.CDS.1 [Saccharomyces cerevisiae]|nr:CPA_1a_G0000840.mRNA.1.CDS.1 [Saccharomyces cerevisiae]CAI7129177.1 CPA_1a_G0000840.mRNA.1.CDS.1 [Saccharomyces cerevisiae]
MEDITYKMNQYLLDNGLCHTPYYFYRDEDCHRYFLSLSEGRTFKKQDESSINDVTDTQHTESFTFSPGTNYQKCLSKAAEIEHQSQNNHRFRKKRV